eukprot:3351991-Alexandrium_andersonii.AAC.1
MPGCGLARCILRCYLVSIARRVVESKPKVGLRLYVDDSRLPAVGPDADRTAGAWPWQPRSGSP